MTQKSETTTAPRPPVHELPQIIGLVGCRGAGKTTAAHYLASHRGYTWLRFAAAPKDMLKAMGLTDAEVDGLYKEIHCDLLGGKTPRYAMQSLATGWGRNMVDENLWVRVTAKRIYELLRENPSARIVVDDVRMPNEAAMLRRMGARLIHIRRPAIEPPAPPRWKLFLHDKLGLWPRDPDLHPTERYWRTMPVDEVALNVGDPTYLARQIGAVD